MLRKRATSTAINPYGVCARPRHAAIVWGRASGVQGDGIGQRCGKLFRRIITLRFRTLSTCFHPSIADVSRAGECGAPSVAKWGCRRSDWSIILQVLAERRMKILVTRRAGFNRFMFTASRFLGRGDEVVGLDNLNDYYDVSFSRPRCSSACRDTSKFRFVCAWNLLIKHVRGKLFARGNSASVQSCAQAGVAPFVRNPHSDMQQERGRYTEYSGRLSHHGV